MDIEKVGAIIDEAGFDCKGLLDPRKLETLQAVRDACAADKCQTYGKSWACPPACGEIEDYEKEMRAFAHGYVFQSVAQLESTMDWEGIQAAAITHDDRLRELADALHAEAAGESYMLLAAGTCKLCKTCTCPDEPCRFPDKRLSSMEAAGLNVTDTCKLADIPYNHGKNSLAYSSCVLFN